MAQSKCPNQSCKGSHFEGKVQNQLRELREGRRSLCSVRPAEQLWELWKSFRVLTTSTT